MKRDQLGFTLVEVLMAMFMVAVIGAGVTSSMVMSSSVVGENSLADQAIILGQKSLEDLRTYSYVDIASGTTTTPDNIFTIKRTVTEDSPEDGMKSITVKVSWKWKGKARSYVLQTIYCKINKT